jgi:PAS domain S-box-containing protein
VWHRAGRKSSGNDAPGSGFAGPPWGRTFNVEKRATGVHRALPAHPTSVGKARRLVREELEEAGRQDLVETAQLLVSELVTNALVHAGTEIDVSAFVTETGLRVEVGDGSHHLPAARHHAALAGTGRGLRMLHQLVDAWGAEPRDGGKVVWFELSEGDRELAFQEPPAAHAPEAREPGTVDVELLNVPLLLHVAWHQHAEALLREYLLIRLGEDGPDLAELQAHAAASEAVALLLDHLPDPELGEDADELMANATEPVVSSVREVLPVPAACRPHFRVLDETLEAALDLADAGAFLTPPTQPEIRSFRRWICTQIEHQSAGGAPTPWVDEDGDAEPPLERTELNWTTSQVSAAPRAMIAADDTNRILALSAPALALLGYDDPSALVGRRLVAIIPPRFRQAHLAGFTLFFSNGRAPLLGSPVDVPALRRDGTEVEVELTVRSERLPGGRYVFVAVLRPR